MGSISVTLSVASLTFLLIILIVLLTKRSVNSFQIKVYKNTLLLTIIGLIIDITGFFTFNKFGPDFMLNIIISKLYIVYYFLWGYFFTIYVVSISFEIEKFKKYLKYFNIGMFIASIIMFILPIHIYMDGESMYSYGLSVNMNYVFSSIYIIVMFYCIIQNFMHLIEKKYIPVIVYIFFGVIMFVIQHFNPELTLMIFGQSIIIFIMYHTIENPDVKMIELLNEAKLSAEKANRAKTEFLSNMSHEIRTPLNAIVGFSDCMLEEKNLDDAKNDANDIKLASENLLEIVNGILDISKIEANKMEIIATEYELRPILDNLVKLVKTRIGEKPIEMDLRVSEDLPYKLYGDSGKIKQIITNILTNAAKYTEEGRINFSVNCVNEDKFSTLVISIEDTGRGIKPDQIDKLFSKFERLEEDRNTTLEGTGLGLAITKRLVEMMGGKIIVQSKYGEGSKFTVYLKQYIIDLNKPATKVEEIKEEISVNDYSKFKVLVVDDNKINIKVAVKLLSYYGIVPESVESGFDCLDLINKGNVYDLILLDDMMPKMSGVETLKKLKEIKDFNTPVVALTANAISGMKEKYLNDGFNDYLSKPIEKDELKRVLEKYLK